ncbi:MAG: DNA-protecting protein DprA [Bdellovibrionales bacterium]|nr:DNA-protecting protein DprA [Bdellovibrionales bacterium]
MQNIKDLTFLKWLKIQLTFEEIKFILNISPEKNLNEYAKYISHEKSRQKLENLSSCEHLQFAKEYEWLQKRSIQLLVPTHKFYPNSFRALRHPPVLSVLGHLEALSRDSLAVVGSRNTSSSSIDWMRSELSQFIVENKVVISSGGARGVDQEAHRITIANNKPTICFLPSGLAKVYPPSLIHWLESIIDNGGVIVSQFSPFTPIYKSHFHYRNELIAALSCATLVVEANMRSGSMMTARYAIDMGKEVSTLPCSPVNCSGKGNLKLLQDGAQLIVSNEDLQVLWARNTLKS